MDKEAEGFLGGYQYCFRFCDRELALMIARSKPMALDKSGIVRYRNVPGSEESDFAAKGSSVFEQCRRGAFRRGSKVHLRCLP